MQGLIIAVWFLQEKLKIKNLVKEICYTAYFSRFLVNSLKNKNNETKRILDLGYFSDEQYSSICWMSLFEKKILTNLIAEKKFNLEVNNFEPVFCCFRLNKYSLVYLSSHISEELFVKEAIKKNHKELIAFLEKKTSISFSQKHILYSILFNSPKVLAFLTSLDILVDELMVEFYVSQYGTVEILEHFLSIGYILENFSVSGALITDNIQIFKYLNEKTNNFLTKDIFCRAFSRGSIKILKYFLKNNFNFKIDSFCVEQSSCFASFKFLESIGFDFNGRLNADILDKTILNGFMKATNFLLKKITPTTETLKNAAYSKDYRFLKILLQKYSFEVSFELIELAALAGNIRNLKYLLRFYQCSENEIQFLKQTKNKQIIKLFN